MATKPKRPRDTNQLAKLIVDIATGAEPDPTPDPAEGKDPAAVALGRKGGLKGGTARAKKLTAKQRSEIARKAAEKRWASVTAQHEAEASPKPKKRKVLSVGSD